MHITVAEYVISTFTSPETFIGIFILVSGAFALMNKIAMKKYVCGLVNLQFSTIIVISVTINLYLDGFLVVERLLHLLLVEGLLSIGVLWFYRGIIRIEDLQNNLIKFYNNHTWLWLFPVILLILMNFLNVVDGRSRIEFQTNYWFSFVRPFSSLCYPILILGIYVNIFLKRYSYSTAFLLVALLSSISSGSKGAFIISIISWYFVYRDIFKFPLMKLNTQTISFLLLCLGGAGFNLVSANVGLMGVIERIVSYGDATILLYQAADPALACADQSSLSLIHRGLARLLGDPTALDNGTLFGFSVSEIFYGGHNYTGPNARIGAYTLCAFPGFSVVYMFIIYIGYFALLTTLIYWTFDGLSRYKLVGIFTPFIIASLMASLVDYNRVMSDVTFIFIGYLCVIAYLVIPKRRIFHGS